MIKRSFFSLGKPGLRHHLVSAASGVKEVGLPSQVRLLVKGCDMGAIRLKVGSGVLTGQKVVLSGDADDYVLSTVTGTELLTCLASVMTSSVWLPLGTRVELICAVHSSPVLVSSVQGAPPRPT